MLSKLPVRQLTVLSLLLSLYSISKLPVRQLTLNSIGPPLLIFSKLPVRQLTKYVDFGAKRIDF